MIWHRTHWGSALGFRKNKNDLQRYNEIIIRKIDPLQWLTLGRQWPACMELASQLNCYKMSRCIRVSDELLKDEDKVKDVSCTMYPLWWETITTTASTTVASGPWCMYKRIFYLCMFHATFGCIEIMNWYFV